MSRRTQAAKRELLPDPKHGSQRLTKFINMIMDSGKKSVAENIVYDALSKMAEKSGESEQHAVELLSRALDNVKPMVEVKSRRVGGATYQVPVEVRPARRETLARWGAPGRPVREIQCNRVVHSARRHWQTFR